MGGFPKFSREYLLLTDHLAPAIEDVRETDLLLFENFKSPFYASTGTSLAYIFRIMDESLFIQEYRTEDESADKFYCSEREISFACISSLELCFPLGPHGRIYRISLKK